MIHIVGLIIVKMHIVPEESWGAMSFLLLNLSTCSCVLCHSFCSNAGAACVTLSKGSGMLGMGVRVFVVPACCCWTSWFVYASNGGGGWDGHSSTLRFFYKMLEEFCLRHFQLYFCYNVI